MRQCLILFLFIYFNESLRLDKSLVWSTCARYGHRKTFMPRNVEDFGDGGAFPEVHIMQYPLDMGRKDKV
jgi:hypothetical protein